MVTSFVLAALLLGRAAPQDPVLHDHRVVLKTSKGEIVLALFPQIAPQHVTHFLRLVRAGCYDGTRFGLIYRDFIIQHGGPDNRLRNFTAEQAKLADERVPAEFGRLHHMRGTLSMARHEGDLGSAQMSFTLLLGDAPQMDGQYTIFGKVEKGFEVLDALALVEVGPGYIPKHPVNLFRAFVVGEEPGPPHDFGPPTGLLVLGGAAIVLGLAAFLLAGRFLPRVAGTIGLTAVFAGFFTGFVAAVPRATEAESRLVPLALFLSLLAMFKLMNKFESPKT